MVYIEEDSEMGQALKDSIDAVYTFRNAKGKDFCDLVPEEGTGLETWSKEEEEDASYPGTHEGTDRSASAEGPFDAPCLITLVPAARTEHALPRAARQYCL